MGNWIRHVAEPRKLFLAWQAPDRAGDRFRWAVALLERSDSDCTLRYIREEREFRSLNHDRNYGDLEALGYQGYPAFSLKRETHRYGVLSTFMRRVPPRGRPDFVKYQEQFRLPPQLSFSDFALLGLTQAKLPSDGFSFVDPLDPGTDRCDLLLEVAGFRYHIDEHPSLGELEAQPVQLEREPENPHDPDAVRLSVANRRIGYINRLQAGTFGRWLQERTVSAVVERLNGRPENPRAFVFVRVEPVRRQAAA